MQKRNIGALKTPIMGRVIELDRNLVTFACQSYKCIQRSYGDDLLKMGSILFTYALRDVKGTGDYKKRIVEKVEEIQAKTYEITALCQWQVRKAVTIDALCDDIIEQTYRMRSASIASSDEQGKSAE